MTQTELAEKMGVNRATLSKYETGEVTPSLKQFEKLTDVLGIPVEDILKQEDREMTIGENIRHLRESHGMTQAELGQIAGVTDKAVSTWEANLKVPRMEAVRRMADYFGVPKSAILDGTSVRKTTGQIIKAARMRAGLTQKELGEKLGITYQTVAQWENDLRKPKIETLRRIAEALGEEFNSLADVGEDARTGGEALRRITQAYERLTDEGREKAAEIIEIMAGNPEYRRKTEEDITIIILKDEVTM